MKDHDYLVDFLILKILNREKYMVVSKRKIVFYLIYILAAVSFCLAQDDKNRTIYLVGAGGLIALSHLIERFHFGKRKIEKNLYDDARAQDK